jgi:hypothetical protein
MNRIEEIEARLNAIPDDSWQLYEGDWVVSLKDSQGKQMFAGAASRLPEARLAVNAPTDLRYLLDFAKVALVVFRAWEQWEASWILCGEAWDTPSGLPRLTQELYDAYVPKIQQARNQALALLEGGGHA